MSNDNGNGRLSNFDPIDLPPEGSIDRMMYDLEGDNFGFYLEYCGKKKLSAGQTTFSREGVAEVVDQIGVYIMARIAKRWNMTHKGPVNMAIKIDIGWDVDKDFDEIGTLIIGPDMEEEDE